MQALLDFKQVLCLISLNSCQQTYRMIESKQIVQCMDVSTSEF